MILLGTSLKKMEGFLNLIPGTANGILQSLIYMYMAKMKHLIDLLHLRSLNLKATLEVSE